MSVLMFARSSGAATPSKTVNASISMLLPNALGGARLASHAAHVDDASGQRGGGGRGGTGKMRACTPPLTTDEVAVGGGGAAPAPGDPLRVSGPPPWSP